MPKKKPSKKTKLRPDMAETAHRVMLEATGQIPKTVPPGDRSDDKKDPEAVKRGRKGGRRGGHVRASKLTEKERSKAAKEAALARWGGDD